VKNILIFLMAQLYLVGQGLLSWEALRSHSKTPHSAELLCRSHEFDAQTSTWQHTPRSTRYPSKRAV